MKKTVLALTMAASVLALAACNDQKTADDEVIAKTKIGTITKEDLYEEMKGAIGATVVENLLLQKALENEYKISDKELKEEINKQKEAYGDNFKLFLQQKGITESFFESNVKSELLQTKMIESLKVSDEELAKGMERAKTEVHARHILVPDEATAAEVLHKLENGGDFEALAKEYSTEPVAQQTGGDLGWFGPGKMLQEFEDATYALKKGEISKPVKTSYGFHIIELLDTRPAETDKTEEEIKAEIENALKGAQFEEKLQELIKAADIDIKDDEFKHVLDMYLPKNVGKK
ncbi:peptidylprolyl isomerase [Sporosarcina highlanderae]|uniref:Foldase protein PrsA n=1 Tax=Sporosarcina highlanderae TaxID=3035916 RepID=A0ABT8JTU2_9BACL|nr:peptidylprolyl isomerase [Sporosarcina highlanderae]MDN4608586.1 peptidylprolyl isomerase [Sporosarcina highlanderae]